MPLSVDVFVMYVSTSRGYILYIRSYSQNRNIDIGDCSSSKPNGKAIAAFSHKNYIFFLSVPFSSLHIFYTARNKVFLYIKLPFI